MILSREENGKKQKGECTRTIEAINKTKRREKGHYTDEIERFTHLI